MKLQTVHLRINDEASGQPTPCRIRISDASGQEYAPFGRSLNFSTNRGEDIGGHVRLGKERWFSIDGACEIALPPGELRVQVTKGLEFKALDEIVHQPAGKMSIRLAIVRGKLGIHPHTWTIDGRCHALTPHAALLDGAAEELDIVNLLAEPRCCYGLDGKAYDRVPNLLAFSGQLPCLEQHGTKVIVNTHHRHPILGSLGLLHCHRVVFPLSFGGPDDTDDWSLADWAGQCHRKGGLVVWTEPFAKRDQGGEALALAMLGGIDAYELSPDHIAASLHGWYQLLNAGIRLPLIGSSGRNANDRPLGALQTVIHQCDDHWVKDLKLTTSKVTNGPVPGLCLENNVVHASAISLSSFQRLELVVNGKVAATCAGQPAVRGSPDICVATLQHEVEPPGWVAARVIDVAKSPVNGNSVIFGHTSADWLGEPRRDPVAVAFLQSHLDRTRDWIENHGRFENPKSKTHLLETVAAARAKLFE